MIYWWNHLALHRPGSAGTNLTWKFPQRASLEGNAWMPHPLPWQGQLLQHPLGDMPSGTSLPWPSTFRLVWAQRRTPSSVQTADFVCCVLSLTLTKASPQHQLEGCLTIPYCGALTTKALITLGRGQLVRVWGSISCMCWLRLIAVSLGGYSYLFRAFKSH